MNRGTLSSIVCCGASLIATVAGIGEQEARADVYEGFDYPAGLVNIPSMNGGYGWAGGYTGGGFGDHMIAPGSITGPASLPATGNSLRAASNFNGFRLTRQFAQPILPEDEVWFSFSARLDNLPSSWWVHFNDEQGAISQNSLGVLATATSGLQIDRGGGELRHYTNVIVFGQTFVVVRLGSAVNGRRAIEVWNTPASGPLGAPLASIEGPAIPLSIVAFDVFVDTSFDEFRMGPIRDSVFLPAPSVAVVGLFAVTTAFTPRRRSR